MSAFPPETSVSSCSNRVDRVSHGMRRMVINYRGRVQGVGFRASVRSIAREMPVTGWVRNEHDGSVRVEVQGSETAIEAFRSAVQTQRGAFISSTDAMEFGVVEGEEGFEIKRW